MREYTKEELKKILESHGKAPIYYTKETRDKILANPILARRIDGIRETGDALRSDPTPVLSFSMFRHFETDGDRTEFELSEHGYFSRRKKLLTYASLAWLFEKPEDVSSLEDILWAVMDEYTWALPAHLGGTGLKSLQEDAPVIDLFAAETGFALAETVALVGDLLSPIVVLRAKREIEKRIFTPLFARRFGWMKSTNNWAAVCAGNVGMAAMYEMDDPERLSSALAIVLDAMKHFLSGFAEDGACLEGLGYWGYGFGYFLCFAEMLRRRTEGEIDLFDDKKVHDVAVFYQKCFFPGGKTVSFSDAAGKTNFSFGTSTLLHSIYPDAIVPNEKYLGLTYQKTGCFRFAFGIRQMTWAGDSLDENAPEPGGIHIFPAAGWYIANLGGGVGVAAKAGHNNEPHNHNDVGVFEIFKNGEILVTDVGGGEYSKDYFNAATRYSFFCNGSQGHSVPIVEGNFQHEGAEYAARDVSITRAGIRSDIAGAYPDENLLSLVRDLKADEATGKITVSDRYSFNTPPTSVVERFLFPGEPKIGNGKILLKTGKETMTLLFDPERLSPSLSTVTDKDHTVKDRTTYVLDFTVRNPEKEFELVFRFA